jgi:hypothetical protein
MKYLTTLILIMIGTGCAILPEDAPPYTPAPMAEEGDGLLYIYRLRAYPMLRAPKVFVDGCEVFSPPEKAYTWMHLSAGQHRVRIDWPWDTGSPDLEFDIPILENQEHYIKISGSFIPYAFVESRALFVDKEVAEKELLIHCKYIEPINRDPNSTN